jgi:WD40 repeat protein
MGDWYGILQARLDARGKENDMSSEGKDPGTGPPIVLAARNAQVWCVAWAPDGRRVAASGSNGMLCVYDGATGTPLMAYSAGHPVTALAWTPDSARLVIGGWSGDVSVVDAASGEQLAEHPTPLVTVYGLALSPDGLRVALAGEDAAGGSDKVAYIPVLEVATGRTLTLYDRHSGLWTQDVAWSPDGALVASAGSDDSTTQIWRPESGETVAIDLLPGDNLKEVLRVAWAPDSAQVAAATELGLRLYDAATGWQISHDREEVLATEVAWSPNGRLLGVILHNDRPYLYDVQTWEAVYEYAALGGQDAVDWAKASAFAWAPDGRHVAMGSSDGTVHIWAVPSALW